MLRLLYRMSVIAPGRAMNPDPDANSNMLGLSGRLPIFVAC